MRRIWLAAMAALLSISVAPQAPAESLPPVYMPVEGKLPESLNAYHLFKDAQEQIPNEGVVPYDLNTPHFADYATLYRFAWVPKGAAIAYHDTEEFEYPIGAAVVLTVAYLNDIRDASKGRQLVETRVFIHRHEGWVSGQYIWNDDATDARLSLAGGEKAVSWIHYDGTRRQNKVLVPNRIQCKMCHEKGGKFVPLGPMKARYLNKDYPYAEGSENQLSYWSRVGLLAGAPENSDDAPRAAVWNDANSGTLDERARAYLDMNCSGCHSPGGLAFTSGLDFSHTQTRPTGYGVYKAPIAAGRGGTERFSIVPGSPDDSIVMRRMRATDPGVRMPVVGRGLVHEEGVALIEEWISKMSFPELARAQQELDSIREAQREVLREFQETVKGD